MIRWFRLLAALNVMAALAGCAASDGVNRMEDGVVYRGVMVGAAGADGFYFMPVEQWTALGPDEAARRAGLVSANSSGPVRPETSVRMVVGWRYLVVPVCGGAADWSKAIQPEIVHQTGVSVAC